MLTIAVLLILAVLLFGSSAVLGAIGWVLGSIVFVIAMVWLSSITGMDPILIVILGVVGFFGLLGLVMLVAKLVEPWETERLNRKLAEERKAKPFTGLPGGISPAEREAIRHRAAAKHYAKKRKKGHA